MQRGIYAGFHGYSPGMGFLYGNSVLRDFIGLNGDIMDITVSRVTLLRVNGSGILRIGGTVA